MTKSADHSQYARNVHVDFFEAEFPVFIHIEQHECHQYLQTGGSGGGSDSFASAPQAMVRQISSIQSIRDQTL